VAIAPTQDEVPVQRFSCFTAELIRMAVRLKGRGVQTVAMQSTGVYWIPLYDANCVKMAERRSDLTVARCCASRLTSAPAIPTAESSWL
jgi:hypothetical protein